MWTGTAMSRTSARRRAGVASEFCDGRIRLVTHMVDSRNDAEPVGEAVRRGSGNFRATALKISLTTIPPKKKTAPSKGHRYRREKCDRVIT